MTQDTIEDRITTRQDNGQRDGQHKGSDKERTPIWRIATWNVRSLQGKEEELEREFEEMGLEILAITETKKKGKGTVDTKNGHLVVYSGVNEEMRAMAGVGCMINKNITEHVNGWKGWSERILTVEIENKDEMKTVIIVYGPNEDDNKQTKDSFWEDLTVVTERAKGTIIILGDFNSRVGKGDRMFESVMGPFGEETRNNNGERMLDFCLLNDLIITNTLFQHKDIHKYTREVRSRGEKSIIDYILIQKEKRSTIMDTRVRRGPEIGSDHYVVMSKLKGQMARSVPEKKIIKEHECLKTYRLSDRHCRII
ncbi:craniofacial development protein 2-like [Coccinella septempunctata]|uniref:craniofacial development protein 2-like n=1 Tax=Coccinella septempunctata TaxID=41139 RepID=UPI001D0708D2|nr:craniofacial development protein 2-like [Coccinella septempunctata]